MPTKGMLTSEFALTVLGMVIFSALYIMGKIDQNAWIAFMTVAIPGYAVSRGMSKVNSGDA